MPTITPACFLSCCSCRFLTMYDTSPTVCLSICFQFLLFTLKNVGLNSLIPSINSELFKSSWAHCRTFRIVWLADSPWLHLIQFVSVLIMNERWREVLMTCGNLMLENMKKFFFIEMQISLCNRKSAVESFRVNQQFKFWELFMQRKLQLLIFPLVIFRSSFEHLCNHYNYEFILSHTQLINVNNFVV